jgi:subtilisin family serine protease
MKLVWRMVRPVTALALAALSLGIGYSPAGGAQASDKVGPGVREAIQAGGARVVVALARPAVLSAAPTDLARVRAAVAAGQDAVLAQLKPADFKLGLRYQAVPALVGTLLTEAGLDQLAALPTVQRIDLDVGGTGHLDVSVPLIGADQWHALGNAAEDVVVAVLDTGMDTDNTDLADDLIYQACFLDFDGTIDGLGQCPNGSDRQFGLGAAEDGAGHGTHVSGIISSGGVNASVGVAPGANIVAVKVLNNSGYAGSFYSFMEIVAALDYILNNRPDVQVINMSLGTNALFSGDCDNETSWTMAGADVIDALRANGVIAFASAGNNGSGTQMSAPACLSNVIAVGATDDDDNVTSFSNSNAQTDLMAPGNDIISSAIGNGTISASGTSMASPHAAGCAALLIAAGAATTPNEIETWLEASPITVTDVTNGLSFPRLDCAPRPIAPVSVNVSASLVAFPGIPAHLNAQVFPLIATGPFTVSWEATGQLPITHTGSLSTTDAVTFTWALTGTQTITVTAANHLSAVTDTVTVTVTDVVSASYLPLVAKQATGTWQTLMTEGFEGAWPAGLWAVSNTGGDHHWAKRDCRAATGSYSAWAIGGGSVGAGLDCGADYVNGVDTSIVYGPISLEEATAAEFSLALWRNTEAGSDSVCILASADASEFGGTCYSGTSGGVFELVSLDLADVFGIGDLRGDSSVWVAVNFRSDGFVVAAEGAQVDEVLLRACLGGVCPAANRVESSSDLSALATTWRRPALPVR